jgi:DNA replicative helicase MCM subunit Mcm2 (Cdc46/Mcm family)
VEVRDVEEAMRLMHEATLKAATDPETGRLDLGNLDGSSREREARSYLANEVRTRGLFQSSCINQYLDCVDRSRLRHWNNVD